MPIYEYQCSDCGEICEFIQKISEEPKTECPHCHQNTLKKLVSRAGFQLKGSGWYVTDFRDKNKPAKKAEEKQASDNKTETNTDTSKATKPTDSSEK